MKIAIIGSGAVGCVFATRLKLSGAEVSFFSRQKADIVESILFADGAVQYSRIVNVNSARRKKAHFDIVIIAVKIYDLQDSIAEYQAILAASTYIVPIQSFLNYHLLDWYGNGHKVYPAAIMFGASGRAGSIINSSGNGHMVVGSLFPDSAPVDLIKNYLSSVSKTYITEHIGFHIYFKVLLNAALVPYSLTTLSSFGLAFDNQIEKFKHAAEILIIGLNAACKKFGPTPLILPNHINITDLLELSRATQFIQDAVKSYSDVVPSIVFDVLKNKQNELNYIFDDLIQIIIDVGENPELLFLARERCLIAIAKAYHC